MKKLLIFALMLALALPAFAFNLVDNGNAKVDMYGQIRMLAAYDLRITNPDSVKTTKDMSDLAYRFQGNSRVGFNIALGKFKAQIETNARSDNGAGAGALGFRQLWGSYEFDNGIKLTAGNKTTLAGNYGDFGDVYLTDNGLAGFGTIADVRRPLIMVSSCGLDVALVAKDLDGLNNNTIVGANGGIGNGNNGNYLVDNNGNVINRPGNNYIPRIDVAYNLPIDMMKGSKVFASYALIAANENRSGQDFRANVHSWHIGTYLKPQFGQLYVKFGAFYGQNTQLYDNYGSSKDIVKRQHQTILIYDAINNKTRVRNQSSLGLALGVGYTNIVDGLSVELAGGWQNTHTAAKAKDAEVVNDKDVNSYAVYLQTPYKFAEGHLMLIPQVGYYASSQKSSSEWGAQPNGMKYGALLAGAQVRVLF